MWNTIIDSHLIVLDLEWGWKPTAEKVRHICAGISKISEECKDLRLIRVALNDNAVSHNEHDGTWVMMKLIGLESYGHMFRTAFERMKDSVSKKVQIHSTVLCVSTLFFEKPLMDRLYEMVRQAIVRLGIEVIVKRVDRSITIEWSALIHGVGLRSMVTDHEKDGTWITLTIIARSMNDDEPKRITVSTIPGLEDADDDTRERDRRERNKKRMPFDQATEASSLKKR
jgi:hypothetical protein